MYIPKNKIKTNLYTSGAEFIIKLNKKPYKGNYWKDFRGTYYTGTNPNDGPLIEIIPIQESLENLLNVENTTEQKNTQNNINLKGPFIANLNYNYLNLKPNSNKVLKVPLPYYPQPTDDEYGIGEFQRYFCKKTNEAKYIEIDKVNYDKLKDKNVNYLWELYIPFTLSWNLKGNRALTWNINRNIVNLIVKRKKLQKFKEYLQYDYLKFFRYTTQSNLHTSGNELVNIKGQPYIGYYHVNANIGPMEGKYHIALPHKRLFYIDALNKIQRRLVLTQLQKGRPSY